MKSCLHVIYILFIHKYFQTQRTLTPILQFDMTL